MENNTTTSNTNIGVDYSTWGFLTGAIVFIGIWIYALASWGLLLGLIFGWIPALIGGFIAGLLWPIVALAVVVLVILIYSQSNTPKTVTKTDTQQFNTRVTRTPTSKPHKVGIIDNTKTLIVCNYGNKKTFTATEAKITFTSTDFHESYLPDNKRVALQKVCQITPQEIKEGLDAIWNDEERPSLFEVKPVYR